MPAKKMKEKKEKEKVQKPEEEAQEVIEVKTSKEPKDKVKAEPSETPPDTPKESTISSFSQLESEELPSEEKKEEPEVKEPKDEEPKVEEPKEKPEEVPKKEMTMEESKDRIPGAATEPSPEDSDKKISKAKIFIVFAVVTVIAIIVGGVFYYKSKVSSTETTEDITPAPQITDITPTPTEVPEEVEEIDYSEYSVSVLNGSGIPGEAGNVKDSLEELGFEDVKTGNAQSYDYEKTEVSLKADIPTGVYTAIEEALRDEYLVKKSEAALDEDSTYDVIIIVGTKK